MPEQFSAQGPETTIEPNRVVIAGQQYETNLSFANLPVSENPAGRDLCLLPGLLDQLGTGTYNLNPVQDQSDDDEFKPYIPAKEINVFETDNGNVVGRESFSNTDWFLGSGMKGIMTGLGYVIEDDRIVGIPTPETLRHAAARMGIDIEFFDAGYISGPDYLQAFSDRKYPVAIGTEGFYKHDIEDDHITAMALGGDPLKESLAAVSAEALGSEDEGVISSTARDIDTFTATLRAVISPHKDLLGEAYGETQGRRTFLDIAYRIGIDQETATQILATAQQNAHELGIPVTELH